MIQNAHEGLQPDRCGVLLGHDEIMLQFFFKAGHIILFVRADCPVLWNTLVSNIHFRGTAQTELRVKNLICDNFSVC